MPSKQKVHAHVIGVPNTFFVVRGSLFRDRRYLASLHAIVTTKLETGLPIFIYGWKRFCNIKNNQFEYLSKFFTISTQ